MPSWSVLLVAATALHAGFQLSVTLLVYPALARVPAGRFADEHAGHSRAVVPLVGLVYGAVLVAVVGSLTRTPTSVAAWTSALATGLALLVTAVRAAPLHGRLGRDGRHGEHGPVLLRGLRRADAVRTLAALLAAAAALAQPR